MSDSFWMYFFGFLTACVASAITSFPVLLGVWLTYRKTQSVEVKADQALMVGAEAKSAAVTASIVSQLQVAGKATADALQDKATQAAIAKLAQGQEELKQVAGDTNGGGAANQQLKDTNASLKEIATEAVTNLELARDVKLQAEGRSKPAPVAPVIPEHNSPTTRRQRQTAELQTLRARLVAATLGLDLPAREASPDAVEEEN